MRVPGSGWLQAAYRSLQRGADSELLGYNLRTRWIYLGFGIPVFAACFLALGSAWFLYAWTSIIVPYLLLNAGLSLVARRTRSAERIGCLLMISDLVALTAALALFGQLQGPMLVLYALVVVSGATMWSARATGIASAVGLASYSTAHYLVPSVVGTHEPFLPSEPVGYLAPLAILGTILFLTVYATLLNVGLLRRRALAAEGRYRAVFEAVGTAVLVLDPETGSYLDANEAAQKMAGISRDEMLRTRVGRFLSPESRAVLRKELLDSPKLGAQPTLHHLVTREGHDIYREVGLASVELDGRDVLVVTAQDRTPEVQLLETRRDYAERLEREVTERTEALERTNAKLQELQSRLLEAERLGTAGEVAGGIAHAVFNPLAALIGTMQMRLEGSKKRDPLDERVLRLAQRIEAVIEGMLMLSRRGRMKMEPLDLHQLIADARDELVERCKANEVRVGTRVEPGLPTVMADRSLLTTALVGIAENGVDAMPDGGRLELEVKRIPGADAVCVEIRDTGSGVPQEIQDRIFEPFFSTKGRGVGLGLAITRGIVHGHEGIIRLDSEPGEGTTVCVELPLRPLRESSTSAEETL